MNAAKAWVAAVGMVVTALASILADSLITSAEWGTLAQVIVTAAFSVATVYGVWRVPNDPTT